jgi:DNA-binding NtrC family response regulator
MPSVLILEDEYALAAALSTIVRRLGAEPVVAASGQSGLEKAARQTFDLVLLDIGLPDMSGLKVLAALRKMTVVPEVLVITAHGTLENALEARRLGARDYFLKPLNLTEMQASLRSLLSPGEEPAGLSAPSATEDASSSAPPLMIGAAPPMQRAFAILAQACATDAPVLLSGPRGSGKTLAAQVIHRHSARAAQELIVFRPDEWPAEEQEKALHQAITQAAGGTLLMEEVGSLPLPLQGLLMRAFGGTVGTVTARLLATTSADLSAEIEAGRFREDLFYHLAVLRLALPALRERGEDLPALAAYLLGRAAPGRELLLSPEALACLKAHAWPGHVRELAAAMHHAAAICTGSVLLPRHLPPALAALAESGSAGHLDAALSRALEGWLDQRLTGPEAAWPDYDALLAHVEKQMLAMLLQRFEDKPTRLAAALKMNRATLRRKLRDLLGRE